MGAVEHCNPSVVREFTVGMVSAIESPFATLLSGGNTARLLVEVTGERAGTGGGAELVASGGSGGASREAEECARLIVELVAVGRAVMLTKPDGRRGGKTGGGRSSNWKWRSSALGRRGLSVFSEEVRRIKIGGSTGRMAVDRIEGSCVLFAKELGEDSSIRARLLSGDPEISLRELKRPKSSLIFDIFSHSLIKITVHEFLCIMNGVQKQIIQVEERNTIRNPIKM